MLAVSLVLLSVAAFGEAWAPPSSAMVKGTTSTHLLSTAGVDDQSLTRKRFLDSVVMTTLGSTLATTLMPLAARAEEEVTLPSGVKYRVVKSGDGAKPDIGELAAIRFAAYCNDFKFDDIFETPEPYYTRVGSGGLIKGVEQTLPLMRTGDRWVLTVPGELAFGKEGRRASAGKPRIPADATIVFDVEIIAVPGKEVELIDLIGD